MGYMAQPIYCQIQILFPHLALFSKYDHCFDIDI